MTDQPTYEWQPTTAEIAQRFNLHESQIVRFDHNTAANDTTWATGMISPLARNLNEYPGASYRSLRVAAALYLDTDPSNIVPGAGIDELIDLTAKAFLGPGRQACAVVPTYPLYEIATVQHHAEFVPILEPRFDMFPVDEITEAAETSDVTWLCVPNNPTGERVDNEVIKSIISSAKGIVVIDAAYAEFVGDRWAQWVDRYPNLLVLHTMSKGFGLAGIRVGFAFGHADLILELDRIRPPGSISTLSHLVAEKALSEPQRMERIVRATVKERDSFARALSAAGISVIPSTANFLLCHVGPSAGHLADALLTEGLVVRSYPEAHPLNEFLRFTVRSPIENQRLVAALHSHVGKHLS
ncbi:MAG: histidinol-phosphate transaminase [Acidimicrobiia bacterium]|nr:MAG: histidinol-phosphate transaminase [Acidimicrobiia bacterium]